MYVEYYLDQGGVFTTIKLLGKKMSFVPPIGAEICSLREGDPKFYVTSVSIDFTDGYAKVFVCPNSNEARR